MPYTSQSSVQPNFDTGGWAPACETRTHVILDWPWFRVAYLFLRTDCRATNRESCWAIRVSGEYLDPPIMEEDRVMRDFHRDEFDRVPVRFFQFGKRARHHLSARRLSEIIASSEKEAGPQLWGVLQRDGVRPAFLRALPNLLLESARHATLRNVMES